MDITSLRQAIVNPLKYQEIKRYVQNQPLFPT